MMLRCPACGSFYRELSHCTRDGEALLESDGVIERYRIVDRLGQGAMGAVYLAEHTLLSRRKVALKMLYRELTSDRALMDRFFREAQAASRIDSQHIVEVIDFGIASSSDGARQDGFLVMEFLEGKSLREIVDDVAPLPIPRALDLALQIAEGLEAAHQAGIVHRDLKPANIVVVPDADHQGELVKLLDFGIALISDYKDARLTRAGIVLGTPAYMSPEQASGQLVDGRADVYALGVILYEMLCGRAPFIGDSAKRVVLAQLTKMPPRPSSLRSGLPAPVEQLVLHALEKEPDDRPQSMAEFADRLREVALDPAVIEAIELDSPLPHATRRGAGLVARLARLQLRRWLWVAGALAGMVAGVVLTLLFVGSTPSSSASSERTARSQRASGRVQQRPVAKTAASGDERSANERDAHGAPNKAVAAVRRGATGSSKQTAPSKRHHRRRARSHRRRHHRRRRSPARRRTSAPSHRAASTRVMVRSRPSGARVVEGKRKLGKTPLPVGSDRARELALELAGHRLAMVFISKGQTGAITKRLRKREMSWEVKSLGKLREMRSRGAISGYTYRRRRAALVKERDHKIVKARVKMKMGHLTKEQYQRLVKAIKSNYR